MKKTEKAARGQTIRTETSPDMKSSFKANNSEALLGRKMGGGVHNVGHSIAGASDTGAYNDKAGRKSD